MRRRRRWAGVVALLVLALCLSACEVRVDVGLIARPEGQLDVLVTVQPDEDVRAALDRAGLTGALSAEELAVRAPRWSVVDTAPGVALQASDVAASDVEDVVGELVQATGLGQGLLTVDVRPVDADLRHGVAAEVGVGVPDIDAFEALHIDPDRWGQAMAAADESTQATLWVSLPDGVDVARSSRDSDVPGAARGDGITWPLSVGSSTSVVARASRPAGTRLPLGLAVGGFAVGALAGLVLRRARR